MIVDLPADELLPGDADDYATFQRKRSAAAEITSPDYLAFGRAVADYVRRNGALPYDALVEIALRYNVAQQTQGTIIFPSPR